MEKIGRLEIAILPGLVARACLLYIVSLVEGWVEYPPGFGAAVRAASHLG